MALSLANQGSEVVSPDPYLLIQGKGKRNESWMMY